MYTEEKKNCQSASRKVDSNASSVYIAMDTTSEEEGPKEVKGRLSEWGGQA